MTPQEQIPGSFRDPSGFLFLKDGCLYRHVDYLYREHYDHLMGSHLYDELVRSNLLVPHEEVDAAFSENAYRVLKPEAIPFISYPYEWCFSALKDAALLTIKVQAKSLEYGMSLKDASVYNIQFRNSQPVFVDSLSFEKYQPGSPWVAYRQFCQHFLAPLLLMSYCDVRLGQLLRVFIDGIPLDLTSRLLPKHTYLRFLALWHIHLHAKMQQFFSNTKLRKHRREKRFGLTAMSGLLDEIRSGITALRWNIKQGSWFDYYSTSLIYSDEGFSLKQRLVSEFLDILQPKILWDLGANTGLFSRIAADKGIYTVSWDMDPGAVEMNYRECSQEKPNSRILPLIIDLTNPSSGIGWEHRERMSFMERGPAEAVLALALVHHLALANNLPLARLAHFFDKICRSLIIEFISAEDPQALSLVGRRTGPLRGYDQHSFEESFKKYFRIVISQKIPGSERTLYLMVK
jgi:hypothetical protein